MRAQVTSMPSFPCYRACARTGDDVYAVLTGRGRDRNIARFGVMTDTLGFEMYLSNQDCLIMKVDVETVIAMLRGRGELSKSQLMASQITETGLCHDRLDA